jgi:hypothetical protein
MACVTGTINWLIAGGNYNPAVICFMRLLASELASHTLSGTELVLPLELSVLRASIQQRKNERMPKQIPNIQTSHSFNRMRLNGCMFQCFCIICVSGSTISALPCEPRCDIHTKQLSYDDHEQNQNNPFCPPSAMLFPFMHGMTKQRLTLLLRSSLLPAHPRMNSFSEQISLMVLCSIGAQRSVSPRCIDALIS